MPVADVLSELPRDFDVRRAPGACIAVKQSVVAELERAGYGLDSDGAAMPSRLAGRQPLFELATQGGTFLIRRFTHGGLLRGLTRARFSDPMRPFRELCTSAALSARGVRTPEVVAARAKRAAGFGWELEVVTRRIEDALDLGDALAMARRGAIGRDALRRAERGLGALVRQLHDLGCLHADLTPNNVLVERASLDRGEPRLWIIDLDRARIVSKLGEPARRRNLERLFRFVARRERRHGRMLSRADYARFLRGYDAGGEHWKSDWRAIEALHARQRVWHALAWKLEHMWTRRAEPRELGRG
jgi:tRNA A-37 threonylcarbamoyl transferase component Bud32